MENTSQVTTQGSPELWAPKEENLDQAPYIQDSKARKR